jgi:hypothetical protein
MLMRHPLEILSELRFTNGSLKKVEGRFDVTLIFIAGPIGIN